MGGTFDPPHFAHLLLAQDVVETAEVDRLYFVPAVRNPHKDTAPVASEVDRLAMLRAAVKGDDRMEVLDIELEREGPSYTSDTVKALEARFPDACLSWVIGADQLPSLPRWHAIHALVQSVDFLVLSRPGHPLSPPDIPRLRWHAINSRQLDLSATEIRARIIAGKPIDFFTPGAVLSYIRKHQLYLR